MSNGIYIGMTSMSAHNKRLDGIADNLANAQTPGFKGTVGAFESFLPDTIGDAPENKDKVMVKTGRQMLDLTPGAMDKTDRPLDLVPEGDAFFAVGMEGGQRAFTRDGRVMIDQSGRLLVHGRPILSVSGNAIQVPQNEIPTISARGEVLVQGKVLDQLATFQLKGELERIAPGLISTMGKGTAEEVQNGGVQVGVMEQGNVNAIEASVELITTQRAFDQAMQAIDTYRRLDESANSVGRIR